MQNWKEPETSTIYLANGEQISAVVNGIAEDDSGYALVHSREVKVRLLPDILGYGEVISVTSQYGEVIEAVLTPGRLDHKRIAYLYHKESVETTICLFDGASGTWREMTDQELEKDRRAWEDHLSDEELDPKKWTEETRLHTSTFEALLKVDGTLWLRGPALHEGFSVEAAQALTRFLSERVKLPPVEPPYDFSDFTPRRIDTESDK